MAILQRCCHCMNIRQGTIACGVYTLIIGLFEILLCVCLIIGVELPNGLSIPFSKAALYFDLILFTGIVIVSIILLIGVSKNNRYLLLPWIVGIILVLIFRVVIIIILIVETIKITGSNVPPPAFFLEILSVVSGILLMTYCILCVVSLYQEFKAGRGRPQDFYLPTNQTMIITHPIQQQPGQPLVTYSPVPNQPPMYQK